MSSNVTNADLVAQVARLAADVEALDRGVIETGLTASRALARCDDVEHLIGVAFRAAGLEGGAEAWETSHQPSFGDPVVARMTARRARQRRIRAIGLHVVSGGGS